MRPSDKQFESALKVAELLEDTMTGHGVMCLLDGVLGTHGVEVVMSPDGHELSYCNTGDPYTRTLCYDHELGEFGVMAWGPWLEQEECDYAEASGTVRCGQCSHWTPLPDDGEWRHVECEACHKCVSG